MADTTDDKTDDNTEGELPAPSGKTPKPRVRRGPDFSQRLPGGELPLVTDLMSETITDITDDMGGWAMGGLGFWLASMVVTMISIPVLYIAIFGGMFGGMFVGFGFGAAIGNEDLGVLLGTLLMILAMFGAMFAFVGILTATFMPMTGSMYRAVRDHQLGERTMHIGSAFDTATVGIVSIILAGLLSGLLGTMGLFFFYIGALVVHALLHLMVPAVALHRVGPLEGARMSIGQLMKEPGWSLGFWGLSLVIAMIGAYIPVLGTMVWFVFVTKGYRAVFGDGETPYEA